MTDQIYDQLAVALQEMRGRLGDPILADRRRLASLLMDTAPDAKREIRVIGTAIDEGVPAALKAAERHLLGLEMDRQANKLESSTGMRLDLALQIVRVLAYALDLGPLPSIYQKTDTVPAPPPPASPPASSGWAGLSQQVSPPPAAQHTAYAPAVYSQIPVAPAPAAGFLDRLPFDKKYVFIGAPVIVALALGSQFLARQPVTPPKPDPPPVDQPATGQGYAGELTDHGVAAKPTLESNVGTPTPLTIPVGRRVTTVEVQKLLASDPSTLLVDVLADSHSNTLKNAVYVPLAGYSGTVADQTQPQVVNLLKTAVAGKPDRPMVFFCMGAICWESYNAVLRAGAAGYRNVYWYRGGLASWQAAGLPMQPLNTRQ